MLLDEKNFLKILEYGKIQTDKMVECISKLLELELYRDNNTYTLSSNNFVVDITPDECTVIFVEEHLNTLLSHIQIYLNQYFHKKHIFYYLLKYFTKIAKSNTSNFNYKNPTLKINKTFCDCIFTDNYCVDSNIFIIPQGFNIFTHRFDHINHKPFFIYQTVDYYNHKFVHPENIEYSHDYPHQRIDNHSDSRNSQYLHLNDDVLSRINNKSPTDKLKLIEKNLALIFKPEDYNIFLKDYFYDSDEYYYEDSFYKVVDGNVFVNNTKNKIASFMFKKGCTLADSIRYVL